eukprot:scaffold3223_cov115-Isochrysis_galbana.AAC.5
MDCSVTELAKRSSTAETTESAPCTHQLNQPHAHRRDARVARAGGSGEGIDTSTASATGGRVRCACSTPVQRTGAVASGDTAPRWSTTGVCTRPATTAGAPRIVARSAMERAVIGARTTRSSRIGR